MDSSLDLYTYRVSCTVSGAETVDRGGRYEEQNTKTAPYGYERETDAQPGFQPPAVPPTALGSLLITFQDSSVPAFTTQANILRMAKKPEEKQKDILNNSIPEGKDPGKFVGGYRGLLSGVTVRPGSDELLLSPVSLECLDCPAGRLWAGFWGPGDTGTVRPGSVEPHSVVECLYACREGLDFGDLETLGSGMKVMETTRLQLLIILQHSYYNTRTPTLVQQHPYSNTRTPTPVLQHPYYNTRTTTLVLQHPYSNTRTPTPVLQHPYYNTRTTTLILQHPYYNTHTTTPVLQHSHYNTRTTTPVLQHPYYNTRTPTPVLQHSYCNTCTPTPVLQHPYYNTHTTTPVLQHSYYNTRTPTPVLQHPYSNTRTPTPVLQHPYYNTRTVTPVLQHPYYNTRTTTFIL
ncbi:hypothetical protein NFI96_010025 [Prochilodus magdalenae]|nr:hypothetical protein NFI96_010025 [Prochilodus magdalenae]